MQNCCEHPVCARVRACVCQTESTWTNWGGGRSATSERQGDEWAELEDEDCTRSVRGPGLPTVNRHPGDAFMSEVAGAGSDVGPSGCESSAEQICGQSDADRRVAGKRPMVDGAFPSVIGEADEDCPLFMTALPGGGVAGSPGLSALAALIDESDEQRYLESVSNDH